MVPILLGFELLGDGFVFIECLGFHALLAEKLGHLQSTRRVSRVQRRGLTQQIEGFRLATFLVISISRGLKRRDRFRIESHALVEFRERDVGGIMLRVEIQDLLEDGDRTSVESVLSILLGDLAVLGDRLFGLTPTAIRIAHFEQQLRIARIGLQEFVVLLQGFRFRALLREFSRSVQYFSFIERQGPLTTAK